MSYDLMFQKAIDLQNAGALNEAETIYLQMLQAMPENSDIWNLLGLVAQSKGDFVRAVDCFLSAIKYAPRAFFAHYFNLGLTYKSLNKQADALEMLQRAAELAPDVKEVWNYLGITQAESGQNAEAIKSFCKALEVDENYDDARVNLCFYTNDINSLFQLADEHQNSFWANFKAAECVEDAGAKERYLQRAVAAAPERTDGLLALAELYQTEGKLDDSLTFYHKVLNLNDKDVSALLGTADIYLAKQAYDKAESYYLKSFEQTRDIAGAYLNYGILLYKTGRTAEALDAYRHAVALEPEKPEISYNLALILKESGDLEEALGLMFNAHIKAPENQQFIINLAETLSLLFKENAELALKIAENWQKQEPNNIFSERVLAGMSGVQGHFADAAYAEKLFDLFATDYEVTMDKLDSQIISKFKELYGDVYGSVLDLGCGTGLAADMLHNDKVVFDGVDVSAKMLDVARQKGRYRQLYHQDIETFVESHRPALDYTLVTAFDVFCYLGDLKRILTGLKGCQICFSIEKADDNRTEDYILTPEGRYKHKAAYVQRELEKCGFHKISVHPLVLRQENGENVDGFLFMAGA